MRIIILALALVFMLAPIAALAGMGHSHGHSHQAKPISQEEAEQVAAAQVAMIAYKGKIDESWKSAPVAFSEKKMFGGREEWVVSFTNDKVADPAKKTLYIFLSVMGEYIAANHTGN